MHESHRLLIRWWQIKEIKKCLKKLQKQVVLYRDLLQFSSVEVSNLNWKEFSKVPILSKETFRKHPIEHTFASNEGAENIFWNQTSGSTGEPFKYVMDSFYIYYNDPVCQKYAEFSKYRFLYWNGVSIPELTFDLRVAEVGVHYPRPNCLYVSLENWKCDPQKAIKDIARFKPDMIEGYPTTILELVRLVETNNLRNLKVNYVSLFGERVSKEQREYIESVLQAEVYCRYSTGEIGVIGVECKEHEGYHLNEESVFVEILGDNNLAVAENCVGNVIVTFFYNTAMPFVRYRTGDVGRLTSNPCACGVTGRRIFIKGRETLSFNIGETRVDLSSLETIMGEFSEYVYQFQFEKDHEDGLVALIVPTNKFDEQAATLIKNELFKIIHSYPEIRVVNALPNISNGKRSAFVDRNF